MRGVFQKVPCKPRLRLLMLNEARPQIPINTKDGKRARLVT